MKIDKDIIISFLLSVLSGLVLGISALPSNLWFLSFIAFIPLFIASGLTVTKKRYLLIFTFQLLITLILFYSWVNLWVIQLANFGFLIGFITVVPFIFLVLPFIILRRRSNKYAFLYFIVAWIAAEMIESFFELGSPFYELGHNLGASPKIIQWYEFTGSAGGSLWILSVNFMLYLLGKTFIEKNNLWIKRSILASGIILIPIITSLFIFYNYEEKGSSAEVLILHPSTDCHNVKYQMNIYELMDIYLGIMLPQLTKSTEFVVLPETAITNAGWVADLNHNLVFDHFREKTEEYPKLKLISGAIVFDAIINAEKIKGYEKLPGIRYSKNHKVWYRTYNSALFVEKDNPVQMRTKEGLVPYQEYAPYPRILPYISPVGIDFQFSTSRKNREVFSSGNRTKTAALICYELVYNRIFSKAARKGAEAFFVLLNEGWYVNVSKVKYQFLQLSAIRAIENRRSIAHSSNMGVSAFIDQRGIIVTSNEDKNPSFLKAEMKMNKKITISALSGNYIGTIAFITMLFLFFSGIIHRN